MPELMVKCVNAHAMCDGGPCPYCEPVWPLRTTDGRFYAHPATVYPVRREAVGEG